MAPHDIHNYDKKLEQSLRRIASSDSISERNKKAITGFVETCFAEGLSKGRVLRYLFDLKNITKFLGKDFEDATKDDIMSMVANIEQSHYAEKTKRDFRIAIRKLYKWLKKTENPEEISWLKVKDPKNKIRLPEEMLGEEEIIRLINAADNPRDKAFVAILAESGCRIGEMFSIQLKHIKFDKYGAQLLVEGKTGFRRIRIITSVPYLVEWVNNHPDRCTTEVSLWIARRENRNATYASFRMLLLRLAKSAGIEKKVNFHNFRHSAASRLANFLTEAQMKEYFGWVQGSEMASVYVHLSGRDMDKALLKIHGISNSEEKMDSSLKPKECIRCGFSNPSTNKFCSRCGLALDEAAVTGLFRAELDRKKADDIMDELIEDEEFRSMLLKKLMDLNNKRTG